LQFTLIPKTGDFGLSTDYTFANAPSITLHVTGVEPGSPAWKADIRPGDMLPLTTVDPRSRWEITSPLPGDRIRIVVTRGSQSRTVDLVASASAPPQLNLPDAIRALVVYILLVFALLVVLRGWNTQFGPLVATIVMFLVINPSTDRIPWTGGYSFSLFVLLQAFTAFTYAGSGVLAGVVLPSRIVGWRSSAFKVAAVILVADAVFNILYGPIEEILQYNGRAGAFAEFASYYLYGVGMVALAALALAVAYVTSRGEARQRMRWIFWGLFPYSVGVALMNIINWNPPIAALFPSGVLLVMGSFFRSLQLALPAALFYGVLLRRVVDIGFVFNRVAVYGALSALLVAIFVLLEYGISHFFLETGRAASLAVQVVVALLIGLSARYLHRVVERVVDRVLFAKRHADERALRRLAREAEAYTSENSLLDRTIETLREHCDATGVAIYLIRSDAARPARATSPEFPATVDLDDELLVSLRRWKEPVDTHGVRTALPDGIVFPLSARGRLVGALACLTKRDASAFDPDERESLSEVSHGLASALDGLSRGDGQDALMNAIRRQGEELAAAIRSLDAKLGRHPRPTAGD